MFVGIVLWYAWNLVKNNHAMKETWYELGLGVKNEEIRKVQVAAEVEKFRAPESVRASSFVCYAGRLSRLSSLSTVRIFSYLAFSDLSLSYYSVRSVSVFDC